MNIKIPPIKSQGIKSKLVPFIKNLVPENFNGTWIEPFMGTGVVGFNLAPNRAILADSNPHLINFYNALKEKKITAQIVKEFLHMEGANLLTKGEAHFYEIRSRFNQNGDPLDFIFINRSCFNGMIRFNSKGGFNVPFCRKPQRFAQAYITKIVNQVIAFEEILKYKDFTFLCQSYEKTINLATESDIIYCDPPYIDRSSDYYNSWTEENELLLFRELDKSSSKFILSTWHSNSFRSNTYIESLWDKFSLTTQEHFYHVGGKESNRNSMKEALIFNFSDEKEKNKEKRIFHKPQLIQSQLL